MIRILVIATLLSLAFGASHASAEKVKVAKSIGLVSSSVLPAAVKRECQVQSDLAAAIQASNGNVELVSGQPKSGLHLELVLTEVHAPPGGMFSGPKWISATGNLKKGSKTLRSFRARRNSSGVFTGTCQTLAKVTSVMGADIGGWLANDNAPAVLGDAR